jgi:hypothetical protein
MKTTFAAATGAALLLAGFGAGSFWKDLDLQQERRANTSKLELERLASASEIAKLGSQIASLESSLAGSKQELSAAGENAAKLEEALRGAQAQLARKAVQASDSGAKGVPPQGGGRNLGKMLVEMMNAPEMKDMMQQQQQAQIDLMYGGLYARLRLNEADRQELKRLIAERVKEEADLGLKMMGEGLSKEQQAAAMKAFTDFKNANELKIKTFLNNEQDYQMFQGWENSKPDRMSLHLGSAAFSAVGEPLSPEQEDLLVKAMTGARTRRTDVPDLTKIENFSALGGDEKTMERILDGFKTQSEEVAAAAGSFLSPKQLEALKTMQEQQQVMQAAGIKMGFSMFNKKKQP